MPLEGVGELVEVLVVERGPEGLPQLVLRDGVQRRLTHDRGVVAVDHLPDEGRLRELRPHERQHPRPERRVDGVGRVQPPPVDAPTQPVQHDLDDQIDDLVAGVVERDEGPVPLEDVRAGPAVGVPVDAEVPSRVRLPTLAEGLLVERVLEPDVVEDAVEHDPQAPVVRSLDELVEVAVVAEARVVAVGRGGEHRPQLEPVGAQRDRVVQPPVEPLERVGDHALVIRLPDGRAHGAQGIDVPPDDVLGPGHAPESAASVRTGAGRVSGAGGARRRRGPRRACPAR